MTIANLPPFYFFKYVDEKGDMTGDAHLFNDQMWQSLNNVINYFNNGITFPSYTTAQIIALEPSSSVGTVWFNSSLAKLQLKTATGVIQTITST